MSGKKNKRPFLSTPFFSVFGRIGGMIVPFLVGMFYGAGANTDSFFLAFAITIAITGLFIPMFESILLPYLTEHKKSTRKISDLANSAMLLAIPSVILISLGVAYSLPFFLQRFSGLGPESAREVSRLFAGMIPFLIFGVWVAGANAIFYMNKIFWFPALSPLIRTLWVLAFILFFHQRFGISAVVWGFVGGEFFRWILSTGYLFKKSLWHFQAKWSEVRAELKELFGQAFFHLLALLALNLIPLANQTLASWLGAGSLSLLNYGDRLFQIPYQLFLTGGMQIFLSQWSENYFQKTPSALWEEIRRDIRNVIRFSLALTGALILASPVIIKLIFGLKGKMTFAQLEKIEVVFVVLMLGLTPTLVNMLYARVLFVLKNSQAFCLQSCVRFGLNVVLAGLFVRYWGLIGIAAGCSLGALITAGLSSFFLKRHWQKLFEAQP